MLMASSLSPVVMGMLTLTSWYTSTVWLEQTRGLGFLELGLLGVLGLEGRLSILICMLDYTAEIGTIQLRNAYETAVPGLLSLATV